MHQSTNLARRENLTALVGTYRQAVAEITEAYQKLESARGKLRTAFIGTFGSFDVIRRNSTEVSPDEVKKVCEEIQRQAWRCIVDRLEIRRILSVKRREELDRQLSGDRYHDIKPLPEITEENILAMLQDGMAKAQDYAKEAVYEVFDWLRPHRGRNSDLKTNLKWQIGKRVIVHAVEKGFTRGKFRVNYHRDKEITALDNVFHMLDGRGPLKTHHGPLYDAINDSPDGTGETDFFRFRCCLNGNLHIEFKRPDLVAKVNSIAGGYRLKGEGK
ncbi:DUF4942 domain-containing protein [Geotalea sp. SG265]|uniref:DUF4942 domain-containing protein n=1 Tax=Geotalea sp. SG265 TaxID=2922867 RepID=UPI001FAF85DB|nr:DUF4942 domain-containing protein [Geotalea sp. SG265]